MPSTSEKGHAKNVANFEMLISYCTGYGPTYAPSNEALSIRKMQTQYDNARAIINDCKTQETTFDNATDARKDAFAAIKPLSTRIVKALSASGVSDSIVEGAKTIQRKIQGKRATPIDTPTATPSTDEPPLSNRHSVSQQSYDYLVEHFNGMIELISTQPVYAPNEADLKVPALQVLLASLRVSNTNVLNANTEWSNTRIERDNQLYTPTTGLVPIALKVKEYVSSVYGTKSPQFKQVSKISFKNLTV